MENDTEIEYPPTDYVYDIESYPNIFTAVIYHPYSDTRWIFEVSDRVSQSAEFYHFMKLLEHNGGRMIGFNNEGYDYLVLHHCMQIGPQFSYTDAYQKTEQIIGTGYNQDAKFAMMVWPNDRLVEQIDLYKIHHFDNRARATSLKVLEFNMRSANVGDLPFPPGTVLDDQQKDELIRYNCHDVFETFRFWVKTLPQIKFREELTKKTGIYMMNYNDTKIGKKFFEAELKKTDRNICGTSKNPRQTPREQIALADVILPQIDFKDPSLSNVLNYLKHTVITNTKSSPELKDLSATVNGFSFDFGTGGIHGSVERRCVRPKAGQKLIDIDVASYYPNLAIANSFYPEHLSTTFCEIYADLYRQRSEYPKGTPENAMLKLALNGVYGDSNNEYSPFYDPQYTMSITINGQLLLCMLAESIMDTTQSEIIQINTDGMTFVVNDSEYDQFKRMCKAWESFSNLTLEEVRYSAMWIRDVNNYIAQYENGDVKRKGAYEYKIQWHQDHSALVVQKAAEAVMVYGQDLRTFIEKHEDAFDFMLRAKSTGGARLELDTGEKLQKVTRYHIAKTGNELRIIYPPLAKAPDKERPIAINKGWKVRICDDIRDFDPSQLNLEWYINEARKLIIV